MKRKNIFTAAFIFFISISFASVILFSYPSGVSGYTQKNNTGCICHTSTPNSSVQVVIAGPSNLLPGATGDYTVTISGGSGTGVGVDIACSAGALTNSDSNLKILNSELTHTSAKAFSSGRYIFSFKYTAPNTAGPTTLYATGCSVKSQWNAGANFPVNVTLGTEDNLLPVNFSLMQNYPNPFNPTTTIRFGLRESGNVKLTVFDTAGRVVAVLIDNAAMNAGYHEARFDASSLSSGIYYYKLESGANTITKKLVLLK